MNDSHSVIMTMYLGLLLVSLIISTALWWANRTVLNRALFFMWAASFVNFVFQGTVSNQSYSVRAISFMMAFPVIIATVWLLLVVLHGADKAKMHWGVLLPVYLSGVVGTLIFAFVGAEPWLTAFPVTIGVNFPIFFHCVTFFPVLRKAKLVIRLFAFAVLLFGIHGLDFFLIYNVESGLFSTSGFLIALILVFVNAMLSNAVVITAMAEENVKKEAERLYHAKLVEVSRKAGMAEVAAGVLHNVGNVLNSINISASLIGAASNRLQVSPLKNTATKLEECFDKSSINENGGRLIPQYLRKLSDKLEQDITSIQVEAENLLQRVDVVKAIINVQQSYARLGTTTERLDVASLIEDAIRINADGFERHQVTVLREFSEVPCAEIDRQRVLQILINVLVNAKQAVSENLERERKVFVRLATENNKFIRIEVADNGVGIAPENLEKIFSFGFTTRKDGHGFGLHNSVNAANEMNAQLTVKSEGLGKGAVFTLSLPIKDTEAVRL